MTLEAGKELDRRCVWDWLNEVYVTPSRAFNEYTDDELKMFAHDALVLLKERERVGTWKQIDDDTNIWSCSECDEPFILIEGTPIENKYYYCPHCGAKMGT